MIFVTVGAQMAFDRLVRAVDAWAARHPGVDTFAQIGPTELRPRYLRYTRFLDPRQFLDVFRSADQVIAHAGMGTIITALELGKPLLVMPRRGDLAETRNDHQIATARRFDGLGLVESAMDETQLLAALDRQEQHTSTRTVAGASTRSGTGSSPATCVCAGGRGDVAKACPYAAAPACVARQPGAACGHLIHGLQEFIAGNAECRMQNLECRMEKR